MKAILICDARRNVRDGLTRVLSEMPGVQRVDGVAHGDELLLRYELRPAALVLIGVRRGEPTGVENTRRFLTAHPRANALVFGSAADTACLATAIAAGARGCLRWDVAEPGLLPPGHAAPTTMSRTGSHLRLTERELQVLRGMTQGKSNGEIGRDLYLSEDTVKTHARRLFRALGVHDRAEAVAHGIRRGFVT